MGPTALYEGLAFGVATYLVRLPTVEWAAPIIENGEATLVESADGLAEHLEASVTRDVPHERYVTPDAMANVSETLDYLRVSGTVSDAEHDS